MGRPRKMEREEILDKVVGLFWEKGFRATSMKDVCDGCGMNPGSLYDIFGDKQGLFTAILDHYRQKYTARRLSALRSDRPLDQKMQGLFDDLIQACVEDRRLRGCLMVNSAVEIAHDDDASSKIVHDYADELEAALKQALVAAQIQGELHLSKDPEDLARFFVATIYGLRVRARLDPGRESLESIARVALNALK